MSKREKRGLGRGLSALMSDIDADVTSGDAPSSDATPSPRRPDARLPMNLSILTLISPAATSPMTP